MSQTETKTIDGHTSVITWYSTSTIVQKAETTVDVYTTLVTTKHVETLVYETIEKPETAYKTIEHGETIWLTKTGTKKVYVTAVKTITEVLPVTKTKHVEATVAVTVPGEEVVTHKSLIWITVSGTVHQTFTEGPSTVVVPETSVVTVPPVTTAATAPVTVETGAADSKKAPAAALLAGIFGAVALL